MICSNCGNTVSETRDFCPYCGKRLDKTKLNNSSTSTKTVSITDYNSRSIQSEFVKPELQNSINGKTSNQQKQSSVSYVAHNGTNVYNTMGRINSTGYNPAPQHVNRPTADFNHSNDYNYSNSNAKTIYWILTTIFGIIAAIGLILLIVGGIKEIEFRNTYDLSGKTEAAIDLLRSLTRYSDSISLLTWGGILLGIGTILDLVVTFRMRLVNAEIANSADVAIKGLKKAGKYVLITIIVSIVVSAIAFVILMIVFYK